MYKVIITGSSGFVGQNLIEYFQTNTSFDVIPVSLRKEPIFSLSTADVIIHLAGKAHDIKNTADDQEYYEVNYGLTKKLYDRFLESKEARTFIFISSVKAAKDAVEGVLTEEAICTPVTAYGKSKLLAEQYIMDNLPEDKKVYILRPCMIHGPGNKGNLNLLYAFAKMGLPFPLAAFDNQRSFLSVDNLTFVIGKLLEKPVPSGIYHIADEGTLSTNELIALMAQSLDRKPKLWKIPRSLVRAVAKVGDGLKLPLNRERLQKLTESYVVSNAKIKQALGEELPVSAKDGLKKTLESFK